MSACRIHLSYYSNPRVLQCMLKLCLLMAAILDGGRGHQTQYFESILPKDHPCHVCFKLADWFQRRRFLNIFPIGSYMYVKTMSAEGGYLGWRSGSLDIILKVVCFKLAYWFQRNFFLNIFPIGSYIKTMSADGGILDGGRGHRI